MTATSYLFQNIIVRSIEMLSLNFFASKHLILFSAESTIDCYTDWAYLQKLFRVTKSKTLSSRELAFSVRHGSDPNYNNSLSICNKITNKYSRLSSLLSSLGHWGYSTLWQRFKSSTIVAFYYLRHYRTSNRSPVG